MKSKGKYREEGSRRGQGAPTSQPGTQSMASNGIDGLFFEAFASLVHILASLARYLRSLSRVTSAMPSEWPPTPTHRGKAGL